MKATVDTPMNTGVLPQISIEYRPIELPKPDPANPRLHSNKQIRQIANSIKTFGFNVPVLVDYGMELDPGHVDTAICRWQTLTGDKARHAATGRYFDDFAAEVEAANAA
jgi:hypothetical protein